MTGPAVDPPFARGLRAALLEHVTADAARSTTRRPRWHRLVGTGVGVLVLAGVGGGATAASGWSPLLASWLPGAPRVAALSPVLESTQRGPASISTADAPAGTNAVDVEVHCIDPGTVDWPDGSTSGCDGAPGSVSGTGVLDLPPGGAPLIFSADETVRWGLSLTYIRRTPTDWARNTRGETFGTQKEDGSQPDLQAATATNGAKGYLRQSELDAAHGPGPTTPEEAAVYDDLPVVVVQIDVYASDGITVVGQFDVPTRAAGAVGRPVDPSLDGTSGWVPAPTPAG